MPRRLTLLLLLAIAPFAAACGGDDEDSEPLGHVPGNAPLVITLDTDVDGEQYRNLDRMLQKFPFGGQVKNQIKGSIAQQGADYEKDIKPILGSETIIAALDVQSLQNDDAEGAEESPDRFVLVHQGPKDKLENLFSKDSSFKQSGEIDGNKLYEASDGEGFATVKDDTLVITSSRDDLQAALDRQGGDDAMTRDQFDEAFEDLPEEPLMRIYGDAQQLITSRPGAEQARNVKWVGALRTFGFVVNAEGDGLALDGRVNTEGLQPEDLPVAAGDEAPAMARFADWSAAQRDPAQTLRFLQNAFETADPEGFRKFQAGKEDANKQLEIDFDRDVIDQFSGPMTVAGGLDGKWALRSDVKDADAMRETLGKMADAGGFGDIEMKEADGGLIETTTEDGETAYLGMEGDLFVAGPDPDSAKQLATVDPKPLDGAQGAMTFVADGEAIAKAAIERSGQSQAAGLFTGPIGDLTAFVTASPENMRVRTKLKIE